MEKLNEPLIAKVLEHIKRFPEAYDQNDVARSCSISKGTPCGAIGCFGGWAVLFGYPKRERSDVAESVDLDEAAEVLGLKEDEANFLFDVATGNPKDDYKTIVKRLADIRNARTVYNNLIKQAHVTDFTFNYETFEGETLTYGD